MYDVERLKGFSELREPRRSVRRTAWAMAVASLWAPLLLSSVYEGLDRKREGHVSRY